MTDVNPEPAEPPGHPAFEGWVEVMSGCMDGATWRVATFSTRSYAHHVASKLRRGDWALPEGTGPDDWEITPKSSRRTGQSELYVRYIGRRRRK